MKRYLTAEEAVSIGLPESLRITPEREAARAQYWLDNPPRAMPMFSNELSRKRDPETIAFEEELRLREAKLADAKGSKKSVIDRAGQRFDQRTGKWVPDPMQKEPTK